MSKKKEEVYQDFVYNDRKPVFIKESELRPDQVDKLIKSDVFCMIPWIHLHGYPNGKAHPCCLADHTLPIGDLHTHTLKEVWNQKPLRDMRVNMINDKPCKECTRCYEQESSGFVSTRNSTNRMFGQHIGLIDQTKEDGTFDEFKLRYYDIRFSNLCNLKCRTCGGWFSSSWHDEETALYGEREYPKFMYAGKDKDDMWEQLQEHIPYLEQIYFAGGEPLIMEEHYRLLNELVRLKRFDVRLQYSTNFTKLKLKDNHVFDYWKQFLDVGVGASLDGMGARGEYIRKGLVWDEVVKNRELMMKECPNVDFFVSSTVSIYNVLHITDFHRDWVERGLLKARDWNINILQSPTRDRINILPQKYKDRAKEKILEHIEWLKPQDDLNRAVTGYESILKYIDSDTQYVRDVADKELEEFFKVNDQSDAYRKEKFEDVFPEYKDLRTYVTS